MSMSFGKSHADKEGGFNCLDKIRIDLEIVADSELI